MDKKIYSIVVEGVKESIQDVKSLKEAIESVNAKVEAEIKVNSEITKVLKENSTARTTVRNTTDELTKVQEKLNNFDREYQVEVARAKAELKEQNKEIKNTIQAENDLKTIEEQTLNTYRDKQNYLTALNRTIRQMSDEEIVAGKTKQQLKDISAAVQQALKNEDAEMKIYVRNVGNYASAVDGFKQPLEELSMSLDDVITAISDGDFDRPVFGSLEEGGISLKQELKEIKSEMADMLANGVKPTDEKFQALAQRAGQIQDAISDANAEVKAFASDTKGLDDMIDVLSTATASYGLVISAMQAFGIENDEVVKGIQKLQAVQTALNSLNALSKTLTDNSTMSYKLYHKALQMVGIEKVKETAQTEAQTASKVAETAAQTAQNTATTAGATSTAALAAAEATETAAATSAASATAAFAASLWAALAPLLVFVAAIAGIAAVIYGIGKAYEYLFGPTEAETKAMQEQTKVMMNLNKKTEENIRMMKAKGATDAEVLKKSIDMYQKNLSELRDFCEKAKEFYGEDSEEYKNAIEEKKKAYDEFQSLQVDGLEYLRKIQAKYRDEEHRRILGDVAYKKKKALEEYKYQVELLDSLMAKRKISNAEAKQMADDLVRIYRQSIADIDAEAAGKTTSNKSGGSSRISGESEAEKAAKASKKAAEDLSKAVKKMGEEISNFTIKSQETLNDKLAKSISSAKIATQKELESVYDEINEWEVRQTNLIQVNTNLRIEEIKTQYEKEIAEAKRYGHDTTELEKRKGEMIELITKQTYDKQLEVMDEANEKREDAQKKFASSELNKLKQNFADTTAYLDNVANTIDARFTEMLNTEGKSIEQMQQKYEDSLGYFGNDEQIKNAKELWNRFWEEIQPDKVVFDDKKDGLFGSYFKRIKEEFADFYNDWDEMIENGEVETSRYQRYIYMYYQNSLEAIEQYGEVLKKEGKSEEEIQIMKSSMYNQLVSDMANYKETLIEIGKTVGDVKIAYDALGNVVEKVPSDGLSKSEKAAKKWGTAMNKFINKYIEPYKEAFDQLGDSVNAVFDAMNDWIQNDIDRISDALDEITEKYEDLTAAIKDTESQIASLKNEFKTASESDKVVIKQKLADEEVLLAQEKAAQAEAFNQQQELDSQKEELEKKAAKRSIEQTQFNAGVNLIDSLINVATGMTKEYSKGVLGIPTATLIGVLGGIQTGAIVAQIAALQAQKARYAEGGYIDSDGLAHGKSHAEGGIDVRVGKQRTIEIEGGEFVINRKSSKKYFNLLSEINEYGKTGKEISGDKFKYGGLVTKENFASGGLINYGYVNSILSRHSTSNQFERAVQNIQISPKVSVVDIVKKTNDYNRVRAYAGK